MTDAKGYILYFTFMSSYMFERGIDKTLADICGRTDGGVDARISWVIGGLMAVLCVIGLLASKKAPPVKRAKPWKSTAGITLFTCIIFGLVIILQAPRATLDITAPQVSWELKAAFCVISIINFVAWALWSKEAFRIWRIARTQSMKSA